MVGTYVYTDRDSPRIWTYRYGAPSPTAPTINGPSNVSSFGEDLDGELFMLGHSTGRICQITSGGGQEFQSPTAYP